MICISGRIPRIEINYRHNVAIRTGTVFDWGSAKSIKKYFLTRVNGLLDCWLNLLSTFHQESFNRRFNLIPWKKEGTKGGGGRDDVVIYFSQTNKEIKEAALFIFLCDQYKMSRELRNPLLCMTTQAFSIGDLKISTATFCAYCTPAKNNI